MPTPNDHSNPFDHIRLPSFDVSDFYRKIEQAQKLNLSIVEKIASYRPPQIDYAKFAIFSDTFTEAIQRSQEQTNRFSEILAGATKGMEDAVKRMHTIVDSGAFQRSLESTFRAIDSISDTVFKIPNLTNTFSVLQDRIVIKDLVLSDSSMPPAGEYRHIDATLPYEQIILTDLTLDPVVLPDAPAQTDAHSGGREQQTAEASKPEQKSHIAPAFLQTLRVNLDEEIYDLLPENADYIDEEIALYEPHKAGIFILTTRGWKKEEKGVSKQSIRLIQYVRRIAKRPGNACASLTELSEYLTKRAMTPDHARSSISNRIRRIQQICEQYNCKPILIKSGGLWRINPDLTYGDRVSYMPSVHRKVH